MSRKSQKKTNAKTIAFERVMPDAQTGLTSAQVSLRVEAGAVNTQSEGLTPSVPKIIVKNTLTLFNFIYLFLAITIVAVGNIENTLFIGIAVCNSLMAIIQELRAKRTLDKLSVLAEAKVTVIRDGAEQTVSRDDIVLDDIILMQSGDQICADGEIISSVGLELDESLLTGETDKITKSAGDTVLAGSYVSGGRAYVRATAIGSDNYAGKITAGAKTNTARKSKLLDTLNLIIKVLAIIIIPIGLMLFYANYSRGESIQTSVLGAAAAMTGMIPGGLVLLTGVTLTVGAANLVKKKALVQSLSSIETLARVDVLCLDKTGTITDGALVFESLEPMGAKPPEQLHRVISELMGALGDQNATAKCLRTEFGETMLWRTKELVPFTSDRKWSGASFELMGTFIIGAPAIVLGNPGYEMEKAIEGYMEEGYRVLCLASSQSVIENNALPGDITCEALLILSDSIRKNASETFSYFAGEGVTIKVISGDNPRTAAAVAKQAGIDGAEQAIDMSSLSENADLSAIVENNTVFGHTSPQQKRRLIKALQENGHTACMTGDGVNDILAMREADCSVAMVSGSPAARNACDFVLMSQNFGIMVDVLREGRRVINNIERVSTLYLVNTIFSVILSVIYTILPIQYPYAPLQMTLINAFTTGIPSFFLALQARYDRPEGRMMANIFEHSFPAALTIVFNTLYIQAASYLFDIPEGQTSTMVVLLVGVVGFYLLLQISKPYTKSVKILLAAMIFGFMFMFIWAGDLFTLESLFNKNVFFFMPLIYFSYHVHGFLGSVCSRVLKRLEKLRGRGKREKKRA